MGLKKLHQVRGLFALTDEANKGNLFFRTQNGDCFWAKDDGFKRRYPGPASLVGISCFISPDADVMVFETAADLDAVFGPSPFARAVVEPNLVPVSDSNSSGSGANFWENSGTGSDSEMALPF